MALVLFALALRLIGIGWGLKNDLHNQSYHPDELPIWAMSQGIEPAKGDFTPGVYNYPTLYLTVLRVTSDVVAVYGGAPDPKDRDARWTYISRCHLAGRILSAIAGALTVLFLFLIARRWVNDVGASMGALLVAVAPGHVVHSRFQTVDVAATFLLSVSLYFALRLLPARDEAEAPKGVLSSPMGLAVLAGLFAGLSAGTKYTGAVVILALLVVLAVRREPGWMLRAAAGCAACVAAFAITTPGIFLDSAAFWRDFAFEMKHTATAHGLVFVGRPSGFVSHLVNLGICVGPILVLLSAVGVVVGSIKRQPWLIAVASFGLVYYVLVGRAEVTFLRYTFPLLVPLACGFAWLMGWAHEQGGKAVMLVMLGIAGLGGFDPGGLRVSGVMSGWMAGADPRDTVARALKEKAAQDTVGLTTDPWFYTPPLYKDSALGPAGSAYLLGNMQDAYADVIAGKNWTSASEAMFGVRDDLMREPQSPRIERVVPEGDFAKRSDWDQRLLTEVKPRYIVFSNFEVVDALRLLGRKDLDPGIQAQVKTARAFLDLLEKDYDMDSVTGGPGVGVHDMDYIRPTIWVWKRKSK